CVTKERYHEWRQNTNSDGSRGKCGFFKSNSIIYLYHCRCCVFIYISDGQLEATVIDGGSGRYHSAHLMKVHMDQIQTLKTEIESLKADQQKEKHSLRAEIRVTADALVQSQAALAESQAENDALKRARNEMESQSIPGTPVSSGTPPPTGRVNNRGGFVRSHSKGRPYHYAVLLFHGCITEERYHEWTQNTNWDGSRGKFGLPVNHRVFIINTASQKFLPMTDATRKSIKDRVNEYLRSWPALP
ncbi:unnamed protein product, partial [Coregonus sp. 'balchen']